MFEIGGKTMKKIILAVFMLMVFTVRTDAGFNFGITDAVKKQSQKLDKKIEKKHQEEIAKYPKWTVMCFESYDNNLEGCALEDLKEMAKVGSTSNMNVVVQFDRSPNYSSAPVYNIPNWTTAKRFYVKQNYLEEKADLGEVNMASSATLSGFIQWAVTNYPADKYVLIFGDHGASWPGFGHDETSPEVDGETDCLTLEEIDSAMLEATQKTGINKFDLIGFDACLQADIQTLHIMKQYGKIYVASEETEPGYGWQYDQILTYLKNNLNTTPQDLGRKIADSYKTSFDQNPEMVDQGSGITLSVIDLEKVAQVETALNGLASAMKQFTAGETVPGTRPNWLELAKSKVGTQNHGDDYYALDIYHLARNLMDNITEDANVSTDDMVRQRAYDCMTAIDSAVSYRIVGSGRPFGYGISIYYPNYGFEYSSETYSNTSFAIMNLWEEYLSRYFNIAGKDKVPPVISNLTINGNTISANIVGNTDNDVSEANFTLAQLVDGTTVVLGSIPVEREGNGDVEMNWNGSHWYAIKSAGGANSILAPIKSSQLISEDEETGKRTYYVLIPAVYTDSTEYDISKNAITLYFQIVVDSDTVSQNSLYSDETGFIGAFNSSLTPINLKDQKLKILWGSINNNNLLEYKVASETELTVGSQGIEIVMQELPAGTYKIGYNSGDYAGNWDEDYEDVIVQ